MRSVDLLSWRSMRSADRTIDRDIARGLRVAGRPGSAQAGSAAPAPVPRRQRRRVASACARPARRAATTVLMCSSSPGVDCASTAHVRRPRSPAPARRRWRARWPCAGRRSASTSRRRNRRASMTRHFLPGRLEHDADAAAQHHEHRAAAVALPDDRFAGGEDVLAAPRATASRRRPAGSVENRSMAPSRAAAASTSRVRRAAAAPRASTRI